METWRLILESELPATRNMATDAFLLEEAETKSQSPIIRIYGWTEPSITIGYHQKLDRAVHVPLLGNTPVVRRVTGGRALLHENRELTYAVAGDFTRFGALGGDLSSSYRLIAQAIIAFYRKCGWAADMARRDIPVSLSSVRSQQKGCFATVSQFEITVGSAKVAAGSQRRTRHAFIQHGSIKLDVPGRHPAILDYAHDIVPPPSPVISCSRDILSRQLAEAFEQVYNVRLDHCPLTAPEIDQIAAGSGAFENLNPVTFSIAQDHGDGSL
jgi:lipoate-protein ligase A